MAAPRLRFRPTLEADLAEVADLLPPWLPFDGARWQALWRRLLHEAALSLPVRAGWGLPSLYFTLQAGLVAFERRTGWPRRAPPWVGAAWTFGLTALPAVLVFHPPFLAGVLAPLLGPRG